MQARVYIRLKYLIAAVLLLCPLSATARTLEIPLQLEEGLLQRLLAEQVYTETGDEARVWDDGKNCNLLILTTPETGIEAGRLRTRTAATARVGTVLGNFCLPLVKWNGYIEVFQQPLLASTPGLVDFVVVDSKLYGADGESRGIIGTLWDWIKDYVHPRFNRLQLDLQPVLNELKDLLSLVFPAHPEGITQILDSVALASVNLGEDNIELVIQFDVPEYSTTPAPAAPEPALTPGELARWEQNWQGWDAFLTHIIKQVSTDTGTLELRTALLAVLLDARQDLLEVLTPATPDAPDPVPGLFVKTWEQLAPALREISASLPASSLFNYLGFISAANALAAINTVEADTGFAITPDALRRMARMIAPAYPRDPLHYDNEVDPELRALFGFGPPLPLLLPAILPSPVEPQEPDESWHESLRRNNPVHISGGIQAAMLLHFVPALVTGGDAYEVLVRRLNGRVPTINTLNEYLPQVQLLLDLVAQSTLKAKPLDNEFIDLYRPLLLATAWQESCWRQYVKVKGEITPIRSHAGAVGIMQVNQHVWRGFYDIDGLQHDVGYNAVAGSEILHHYLVDYAIARGEHHHEGGPDNLMRATYAMYNGGPRHISRYRNENTLSSLRAIDQGFWEKFRKVRSGNTLAVAECYTG